LKKIADHANNAAHVSLSSQYAIVKEPTNNQPNIKPVSSQKPNPANPKSIIRPNKKSTTLTSFSRVPPSREISFYSHTNQESIQFTKKIRNSHEIDKHQNLGF